MLFIDTPIPTYLLLSEVSSGKKRLTSFSTSEPQHCGIVELSFFFALLPTYLSVFCSWPLTASKPAVCPIRQGFRSVMQPKPNRTLGINVCWDKSASPMLRFWMDIWSPRGNYESIGDGRWRRDVKSLVINWYNRLGRRQTVLGEKVFQMMFWLLFE